MAQLRKMSYRAWCVPSDGCAIVECNSDWAAEYSFGRGSLPRQSDTAIVVYMWQFAYNVQAVTVRIKSQSDAVHKLIHSPLAVKEVLVLIKDVPT